MPPFSSRNPATSDSVRPGPRRPARESALIYGTPSQPARWHAPVVFCPTHPSVDLRIRSTTGDPRNPRPPTGRTDGRRQITINPVVDEAEDLKDRRSELQCSSCCNSWTAIHPPPSARASVCLRYAIAHSLLNSLLHPSTYTPSPSPRQYCKEYVCRFVCLLVYLQKPHGRTLPNFLCMSTVVVARASSGGVAIRYVFPVLWMTPCFHTWCVVRIPKRRERITAENTAGIATKFCSSTKISKYTSWTAHWGRILLSVIS